MIFCCIAAALTGVLLVMSARICLPPGESPPVWMRPLYKAAFFLLKLWDGASKTCSSKNRPFETERLAYVMLTFFIGAVAGIILQFAVKPESVLIDGYQIRRPDGRGETYTQELLAVGEDSLQTEQIEISVKAKQYSSEEKRRLLKQEAEKLDQIVIGENSSAEEVRGRVILPAELADGEIEVQWMQTPQGLLDEDGFIDEDISEDGEVLQLKAILSCGGEEAIYECALRLFPPIYGDEEKFRKTLEKEVEKSDMESAQEAMMQLPREIGGQKIDWETPQTSAARICFALAAVSAAGVWIAKNQEQQNKAQQKRRQMILDYPDLLFKLSMLLGAGLTMRNAFCKIALEYREGRTAQVRYVYEEMLAAYYEMRSGIPEARAYENFGRRCGEPGYLKLGTMLSSNLQKGSEGLARLLQEEAAYSMEERRQMAKKLGEEAGTKLLMPMVLMLLVVLVILMVPAVLAF